MSNLTQLVKDVYENKHLVYNEVSGQDAIRNLMFEALKVPAGTTGRELHNAFRKNKYDVYEIIDIAVDAVVPTILNDQFNGLANFHDTNYGQELRFTVKDNKLFRVASIAEGMNNPRRQNKLGTSYKVDTGWLVAATYVEWEQFMAGQVDLTEYMNTVAESFAVKIGEMIYDAIDNSYDGIRATRRHFGAGSVDLDKVTEIANHVKAASGGKAVTIYGTVGALSQVSPDIALFSDGMKDGLNQLGYLGTVSGMRLVALPYAYRQGTEEFAVNDNSLLIIPSDEKIVDVVREGGTVTDEGEATDSTVRHIDFSQSMKVGVGVKQSAIYGYYKIA